MHVNRLTKPVACSGFTLVELAIVILIVGLLLGGLMGPLSVQMENNRAKTTTRILLEVQQAIIGFAIVNRRLPCPDTNNDGQEDTPCGSIEGNVPWATLGTGRYDAWSNPIRYRPDAAFTASIANPADTASGLSIRDVANTLLTVADPNAPVALIFSCGPDGLPNLANDANGTPDTANCANPGTPDSSYVQDVKHLNQFDDQLVWISKSILLNQLVQAGKWP